MRSFLALAACSLLAVVPACTEHVIIREAPAPAEEPGAGDGNEPPAEPVKPAARPVIDLGEVTAGTDVEFEIPEGALGFNITAEGTMSDYDPQRPYGIERITAPNGKIVHDDFTPRGGTHPTSTAAFDTLASASVPQGDGVPEKLDGTWKVRFGVAGATSTPPKLRGLVRVQSSGDGVFHGGKLDLHVHVPVGLRIGRRTVDPAQAASDPGIQQRIETFFALTTELLGIVEGEVVFHEESAQFQELDGFEELLGGFAISKGQKDGTPALHVLLTNTIAMNGEPFAAGISPGIPGAAATYGRGVSGIIVATSESADEDVNTMLHEAGHFFGLNHTTELRGGSDPLPDTPVCEDLTSFESLRSCPDRANVMFVTGAIETPTLSPKQQRVYRGSPNYTAFDASAGTSRALVRGPATTATRSLERRFRISASEHLSPIERELSLGFCGLTTIDAGSLVKRHGRAAALAQLRAAAADADLVPFIRGRANLALKALGAK